MARGEVSKIYEALALPNEAIVNGGVEVLRIGVIRDDLYVSVRNVFKDPAKWGEMLADITGRLAALGSAGASGLTKKDVQVQIAAAYVAALGAHRAAPKAKSRTAKRKTAPRRKKR